MGDFVITFCKGCKKHNIFKQSKVFISSLFDSSRQKNFGVIH